MLLRRRLIHEPYFESDYTALTASGAQFLATKTSVKLVGIDYLGIGTYGDDVQVHLTLFKRVSLQLNQSESSVSLSLPFLPPFSALKMTLLSWPLFSPAVRPGRRGAGA